MGHRADVGFLTELKTDLQVGFQKFCKKYTDTLEKAHLVCIADFFKSASIENHGLSNFRFGATW